MLFSGFSSPLSALLLAHYSVTQIITFFIMMTMTTIILLLHFSFINRLISVKITPS